MAIDSPLTDKDYEGIREQLATLDELEAHIKRAKSAGLDVSGQQETARQHREQLMKLKQAYFPNRP